MAGGQAIFQQKCMFFQLLSTIKVKLVDKMKQSTYLWYFSSQAEKITNSSIFLRDFWFFVIKSKVATEMATMFGEVTGL